jgi:hypothetical protein
MKDGTCEIVSNFWERGLIWDAVDPESTVETAKVSSVTFGKFPTPLGALLPPPTNEEVGLESL